MDVKFREVEHSLCIVLDNRIVAVYDSENPTGANGILCYGYIDKDAGLTFEGLGLVLYDDGDYTLIVEKSDLGFKIRAGALDNAEIIPIKNQALRKKYAQHIELVEEAYYSDGEVERTRDYRCLDKFRHPHYPDDVLAVLYKPGLKPEQLWVRIKSYIENCPIEGTEAFCGVLLNQPFEERYGVCANDKVMVVAAKNPDADRCVIALYE